MKLTVKNFGPVKETEVEVNNLNILMGDNNGGKTYLSYLVYGAMDLFEGIVFFDYEHANMETILHNISHRLSNWRKEINNKSSLAKLKERNYENFEVKLFNIISEFKNYELDFEPTVFDLLFTYNMSKNTIAIYNEINLSELLHEKNKNLLSNLLAESVESDFFFNLKANYNLRFFSSERNGVNLFHKAFDRHNSNLIQKLQNGSISSGDIETTISYDSVKVTKPVTDNISFTRDIEFYLVEKAEIENNYILKIFEDLIGGKFSKAPNAQITFDQEKDGNLIKVPLYLASSAARCLSDLYFYLKHLAKKNDVIFIDEPESHLTLDRQRIMAKLLVAIANAGVKVWVTTHSDFMVREVNNLIKLSADLPGKAAFLKEYADEYTEQDCIKPEEVNMYNMVNGVVEKIAITEKGMAADSFLDLAIHKANTVSMDINYFLAQEEDEVNE